MLDIIGILVGVGISLGLISKQMKGAKYVIIGVITAFGIASGIVSYVGGMSMLATNATTVMYFLLYALFGLVVTEVGVFFGKHAEKIRKAI